MLSSLLFEHGTEVLAPLRFAPLDDRRPLAALNELYLAFDDREPERQVYVTDDVSATARMRLTEGLAVLDEAGREQMCERTFDALIGPCSEFGILRYPSTDRTEQAAVPGGLRQIEKLNRGCRGKRAERVAGKVDEISKGLSLDIPTFEQQRVAAARSEGFKHCLR